LFTQFFLTFCSSICLALFVVTASFSFTFVDTAAAVYAFIAQTRCRSKFC